MPLTPTEVTQAKALIGKATNAAEFQAAAHATEIRWWDANTQQRKELVEAAAPADVKEMVGNYCQLVSEPGGRQYLLNNIIAPDKKGRAYWFQEYLMESARGVSQQEKKLLQEAFNKLLYKAGSATNLKMKTELNAIPAQKLREILLVFLQTGFLRVPSTNEALLNEAFEDHVRGAMKHYSGPKQYKMRWRSDSRSYDDIRQAGGFLAKARSAESYAQSLGLREPWHPFSDPAVRKYMWFRKGHADNCLNTVVSVGIAKDWQAYLPFPLMRDYPNKLQKKRLMIKVANNQFKPVTIGVAYTWLYLFIMSDLLAFKTGEVGATFGEAAYPEIGVAGIPVGNVYGAVKFARVYHAEFPNVLNAQTGGALDEAGFTAYPIAHIEPPRTQFMFANVQPPPPGVIAVRNAFNAVIHTEPVHVRWTSGGFSNVPAAFDIGGTSVQLTALDFKALS
jgi:hypothetical protein